MGRRKSKEVRDAEQTGEGEKGATKRDVVREALQTYGNDAKPKQIREFAREKFGLEMSLNLISNYKNNLLKKSSGQSGLIRTGRPGRPAGSGSNRSGSAISVQDIETLKQLTDRLGAEQVRALVGLLGR